MAYRKFDSATWQDPWFEALGPFEKYAFVYLFTNVNCTPSGIYNITPKRFKFDTGVEMVGVIENLSPKVEWFKQDNMVWVKSFFKHQCQNSKFAVSALNSLRNNRLMIDFVEYNRCILDGYPSIELAQYINKQS